MKLSFSRSTRAGRLIRPLQGASLLLVTGASAVLLSSCSGGAASKNGFLNQNTGLYTSADQTVGNGIAHTFVELKNGIPIREGVELSSAALDGLPNPMSPAFLAPTPSVTNGSPFTNVILTYLPSSSASQPAQFQLSSLIRSATVATDDISRAPVASGEIPAGYIRSTSTGQPTGNVISGGGVIYDDPRVPAGLPADTTQGQQYLYYAGHLNGILLGPTIDQLKSKATISTPITQLPVYPRDGYYPTQWEVTYDTSRQVHVVEMTHFIRAPKFLPPGS